MEIVVFTNGCFDLVHPGHIDLLKKARAYGTKLIVGLNSDRSVRAIKGSQRPFLNQTARATVLEELRSVDEVRIFDDNTPEKIIREIKPNVLVKGGDWAIEEIVGADFVLKNGGKVFSIPFIEDYSTSKIAEKIKSTDKLATLADDAGSEHSNIIENFLKANVEMFKKLLTNETANLSRCAGIINETLKKENKIYLIGDGKNFLVLENFRAVFSLKNVSLIEKIEQLNESLRKGDLLIAFTSDGHAAEVIQAVMKARQKGCQTISLTGSDGVKIASLCDASVSVTHKNTEIVNSAHNAIGYLWREIIQNNYSTGFLNG